MKCDEMNSHKADVTIPVYGTIADAEVYLKEKADDAIAELKAKLEDVQATAYADSVDAGMRERRLKRAFYKACAMWADRTRLICSVFGSNAPKIRWERMYENCLVKARKYK